MDAVKVLAIFLFIIGGTWALGAHGLAVALSGCMVVVAIVELIWYLRRHQSDPARDTISKEAAKLAVWRLAVLSLLIIAGAVGLVAHFWAMR